MTIKTIVIISFFYLTGCLQTRSDSGGHRQSQIYRKKNIENQNIEAEMTALKVDERDELIRTLNGRVEALENKIDLMQKEKVASQNTVNPDSQKIILLQEALSKMEMQLQKLESEKSISALPVAKPSDASLKLKKVSQNKQELFDSGEDFFQKKEWKKAILSYQSHIEQFPKLKNVPEAKYKIGVCFQELGLKDEATAFYEEVLSQYPKSEPGKKAKIRLASLSSKQSSKKAHN